ncbi:MAG: aminopeptidase P family protein [Bacteroidetes bacterium]|nr:MAG: aminopeptidase P family protein [Bacteroidota bacterium]
MKNLYKNILILILGIGSGFSFAQEIIKPTDYLSKEFHKDRREKLREALPNNSVAVFFANAERNRANDVDYVYHQDPDFYYLTGYSEPDAVLLVFKDAQKKTDGASYTEIIFVRPRDKHSELWYGRRLGDEGVKEKHALQEVFNNYKFRDYPMDFSKFDDILFNDFKNDVRDKARDDGDLYDLIIQFKGKVNYPSEDNTQLTPEPVVSNLDTHSLREIMGSLRGIKTPEEIILLKKAINISAIGQVEVMKAMHPGMSETEVQGIHEFVFKKYGAEYEGYPSIVGAGHNGCILHYVDNIKPEIDSKELILMDLGAEYHGYTADVTRTIPVNGKFSPEQKAIYELVLAAQTAAMAASTVGVSWQVPSKLARDIINQGLVDLGIIDSVSQRHTYYPHGLSHHIGLDVHDNGSREVFARGMVFTVEPGIYIPQDSKCDEKWWGIAVRIEDDVLIDENGKPVLLSGMAPRSVEEIEKLMAEPSILDKFVLPDLDEK